MSQYTLNITKEEKKWLSYAGMVFNRYKITEPTINEKKDKDKDNYKNKKKKLYYQEKLYTKEIMNYHSACR